MSLPTRRDMLAGVGAGAVTLGADEAPDAALRRALDAAQTELSDPPPGPWPVRDEGEAATERRFSGPARAFAKLASVDACRLSPRARLELEAVRSGLQVEAALAARFAFGAAPGRPFVVDPRTGTHLLAARGLGGPKPTAETADPYVAALRRLAASLDGETRRMIEQAKRWRAAPVRRHLMQTRATLQRLAVQSSGEAALVRDTAIPSVVSAYEDQVRPALARQAQALEGLIASAPEGGGAERFRDGEAFYGLTLRAGLGADISPPRLREACSSEIARLGAELDDLLAAEGLTTGGRGERLRALMRDPAWLYADDDAGRDRAVVDMNAVLDQVRRRLPALHPSPPPGPVRVLRMSRADEAAGRAGYRVVAAGGGDYVVDLHAIRGRPAWTLPTVVLHETLPGHLLQLPLQAAADPDPLRVRYSAGYFEGWGVYAEGLGEALGLYDRRGRIGHLQSMLFRLSRAVADVGVHLDGWTPERTRAELADLYGDGLFNSLDAEVERVFLSPGTGGADALGRLEMMRLRRLWRGDLARFHAAVLNHGPYPTGLLARAVELAAG